MTLTDLIPTEQINPRTAGIDLLPTAEILALINAEDRLVPDAVAQAIPQIAQVVDAVVAAFRQGGHLYYIGAGTSGRLGVLDASECPPTYGVKPDLVQGIIAGGDTALRNAAEGAEDFAAQGRADIEALNIGPDDVLVGLSASGGAAYVVEALKTAKAAGAVTGAITCNAHGMLARTADIAMVADVGPEVIAGSTRMKAGTAQKLILNMITTGAMIAWGKTYHNLMVDMRPTNIKLKARALRLITTLTHVSDSDAETALERADGRVKTAIVMLAKNLSATAAEALLTVHQDKLRAVLESEQGRNQP